MAELIGLDGERVVDFSDGEHIVPQSARDDVARDELDAGWGEGPRDSSDWLRDERPPHWE